MPTIRQLPCPASHPETQSNKVDWLEISDVRLQLGYLRADVAGENAWFDPHPLIPLDHDSLHHWTSSYWIVTSLPRQQIACYEAYKYVYHRPGSTLRNMVELRASPDTLEHISYPAILKDAGQRVRSLT